MPGIEADDVVPFLDHRAPPRAFDVVLELDLQRPVVPHGVDAAVDLRRGEDEAAPLRKRDDRLEVVERRTRIVGRRGRLAVGDGHRRATPTPTPAGGWAGRGGGLFPRAPG